MNDSQAIASQYLDAWNASDEEERMKKLQCWADGAVYTDPLMNGKGREGIAAMIRAAREQFPGHHFEIAGVPVGHSQYVRFSWILVPESGSPIASGTDFVRLNSNGEISEVVGFLDKAAA